MLQQIYLEQQDSQLIYQGRIHQLAVLLKQIQAEQPEVKAEQPSPPTVKIPAKPEPEEQAEPEPEPEEEPEPEPQEETKVYNHRRKKWGQKKEVEKDLEEQGEEDDF